MFRRAAREIRVTLGLLLVVAAIGGAVYEVSQVTGRADQDFAVCGGFKPAPDCVSKRRPVSVFYTDGSQPDTEPGYEIVVQTSPNVTMTLYGLTKANAAPFRELKTTEIRYRQGRLVAVVAPGGTSYEFPFAFTKELAVVLGSVVVAGLLGMGSVAWGLTRVNRTPQA